MAVSDWCKRWLLIDQKTTEHNPQPSNAMVLKAHRKLSPLENSVADCVFTNSANKVRFGPLRKDSVLSSVQGGSVNSKVDLWIKNWKGRSRSWELPFEFQTHHVQSILAFSGKPLFERCRRERRQNSIRRNLRGNLGSANFWAAVSWPNRWYQSRKLA